MLRLLVGRFRRFAANPILTLKSKPSLQVTLGVGVYAGIYISQNYQVPRVDEPAQILQKLKAFADEYKKDK